MGRENNNMQIWGNKESMNLNPMILTNIQSSTYFKQKLIELKTYHGVIDEIYYRVNHLEPWEKGSRRTQGLTGMCGGVRGVGGGGIVSSAYCLVYKLYTLKLTRKQVVGLMTHQDSPYIRALGFMYIRYTQNPQDLFDWYCEYLDDEEEIDVKAGGGMTMTIGQMLRQWLIRLEWFDTLFPRIPVPIQKEILDALRDRYGDRVDSNSFYDGTGSLVNAQKRSPPPEVVDSLKTNDRRKQRESRSGSRSVSRGRDRSRTRSRSLRREREDRKRHRSRSRSRSKSRSKSRSRDSSERRHRHHRHKHSKHSHHKSSRRDRDEDERQGEARSSNSRSKRNKDD